MYDPFWIYDAILEQQYIEDMGFETVQEFNEWRENESARNRKSYLERNRNADI